MYRAFVYTIMLYDDVDFEISKSFRRARLTTMMTDGRRRVIIVLCNNNNDDILEARNYYITEYSSVKWSSERYMRVRCLRLTNIKHVLILKIICSE